MSLCSVLDRRHTSLYVLRSVWFPGTATPPSVNQRVALLNLSPPNQNLRGHAHTRTSHRKCMRQLCLQYSARRRGWETHGGGSGSPFSPARRVARRDGEARSGARAACDVTDTLQIPFANPAVRLRPRYPLPRSPFFESAFDAPGATSVGTRVLLDTQSTCHFAGRLFKPAAR